MFAKCKRLAYNIFMIDFQEVLKKHDLKVTSKRLAVLSILEQNPDPLSIEEITNFLRKKKIKADQVTIYRIIEVLQNINLVTRINFHEGKFRYELATKPHHHHAVCIKCGRIEELPEDLFGDVIGNVSKKTNFQITGHAFELFGLCHNCQ